MKPVGQAASRRRRHSRRPEAGRLCGHDSLRCRRQPASPRPIRHPLHAGAQLEPDRQPHLAPVDDGFRNVYVYGGYRDLIRPVTVLRPIDAALDPTKQAGFTRLGFACADGSNSRLSDSGPGGQHAPESKAPSIDTRWSSFRDSGLAVTHTLPSAPSLPGRSAPSAETRTGRPPVLYCPARAGVIPRRPRRTGTPSPPCGARRCGRSPRPPSSRIRSA